MTNVIAESEPFDLADHLRGGHMILVMSEDHPAYKIRITDEGYEKLLDGWEPKDLPDGDVIQRFYISEGEWHNE